MSSPLARDELARLTHVLGRADVELDGELTAEVIAQGRSNLTMRLDDGCSTWVLRMPPRVGRTPSAHDVVREFRVTAALRSTGVPVPPAVLLCEEESVLGAPFAVAEFVNGSTVQSRGELEGLSQFAISTTCVELVETIAALHSVDHEAVGLADFGRPDGYAERQLRRWSGQWEIVGDRSLAGLEQEVLTGLQRALPAQQDVAIVHGDFRIDNTILDLSGDAPRIAAVVDWELSTIGDPVADVAMMCAYRHGAFDDVIGSPTAWASPDLPTPDELVARYEATTGSSLHEWTFHLALAAYKIAVIAAGIAHRHRLGSDATDPTAARAVGPYLEYSALLMRDSP